jgi:hypothetical protein
VVQSLRLGSTGAWVHTHPSLSHRLAIIQSYWCVGDFVGLTVKKILPDMKGENMEDTDNPLELPSRANNDRFLGVETADVDHG